MSKRALAVFILCLLPFFFARPVIAQEIYPEVSDFTNTTLQIITTVAAASAVFFLIKGGYLYMTSSGKPEALESAKRTLRNALIGLLLVLSANVIMAVFRHSLHAPVQTGNGTPLDIVSIETVEPSDGLTQVLIDAVSGFIQNIVESATEPIVEGIVSYLTTTPTLFDNQVVRGFWLISLGIVDTLFVLVVALLGLQLMSAETFGFEEVELKRLLPSLGLAFLGANISLFLLDYLIILCNTLVTTVLNATGGLNHAWVINAITPKALITGQTPLIILVFMVLFLIVSIVLLLMYISRLIIISLSAALSPFIFLLWAIPKFKDFALISLKTYAVTVFTVFIHVVIIQLAGSFLALPEHSENSLISIAVAIGLFFTLIKTPSVMMHMVYYVSNTGAVKKVGSQIINVISTDSSISRQAYEEAAVKIPRKVTRI